MKKETLPDYHSYAKATEDKRSQTHLPDYIALSSGSRQTGRQPA